MQLVTLVSGVIILLFGFVVFFGAPYLPTLKRQTATSLELLNLKKGQTFLELGCGDGRVLKAAAKKGLVCVGYELNPVLVLIARLHTWRYRNKVKVIWGDYWRASWPRTDGIFVFLLDKYMEKLDKKIVHEKQNSVKLVSFAFKIPGKKPIKSKDGLFLYQY